VAPVFETRIEVAGADGLLSYDSRTAQEEVWRRRGGTAAPSPAVGLPGSVDDVATEGDPFVAELRDFALAVRTGARPKVDARDGERAVEVAAAVARSLATGLPVKVEGPAR
jgi:myo-inositol 2-dehydrogenase/D-chiro-inositol 1-dehydrogenase